MTSAPRYTAEPSDPGAYTATNDRLYSRFSGGYDLVVKLVPVWRGWLARALPEIRGPRVLEVSFGTGWLLTRYAGRYRVDGIDLNPDLLAVARRNLERGGLRADLRLGRVESLGNRLGTGLVRHFWIPFGDLVRDVARLLVGAGLDVEDTEIGGWGSVHLYRATKPDRRGPAGVSE